MRGTLLCVGGPFDGTERDVFPHDSLRVDRPVQTEGGFDQQFLGEYRVEVGDDGHLRLRWHEATR
jgi:hypothetical protein